MNKILSNNNNNIENDYPSKVIEIWRKFEANEIFKTPQFEYKKHSLLPK